MKTRFKVGQTVYMDRGDKMRTLVVKDVIDNGRLPIMQYTFEAPNDGFAVGEQSIRSTPDGRDLKLSECFKPKNRQSEIFINTIASAKRNVVDASEFGLANVFRSTQVDFKPDITMSKWLVKHANGRLIIHVGSGQGHLVRMIKQFGKGKAVGIEPNIDKMQWVKLRIDHDRGEMPDINEILEGGVENYKSMINALGAEKAMLIIARPKSMRFVKTTYELMPKGMELLYITREGENLIAKPSELLEPEGKSEDNEVVYSLIK